MGILRCGCRDGVVTVCQGRSTVPAKCPQCDGKKLLKCGSCKGTGIDPDLVRTASKRAETSPVPSPTPENPGTNGVGLDDPRPLGKTPDAFASPEQLRDWQQAYARQRGASVEQQNSIGMRLALIQPGEFQMGSSAHDIVSRKKIAELLDLKPPNEALTDTPEETPRHFVTVSKSFLLGAAEVTTGQFRQFVSAEKFQTDAERTGATRFDYAQRKWLQNDAGTNWRTPGFDGRTADDCPVTSVSWNDAAAFCNWLSAKENLTACYRPEGGSWALNPDASGYRLPTEAEWEYACRAGTKSFFSAGNLPKETEQFIWCFPNAPRAPQPVGTKRPNGFGLYDMHGNVAEWCQDRYAADYYGRSPRKDPTGAESGGERVVRGGDWYSMALFCRSAKRVHFPPASAMNTRGFRVARTY
jgi:formylglycine-generating enzyme required for sulfatase activity